MPLLAPDVGATDEQAHRRAVHESVVQSLEVPIVERQQLLLVEFDLIELVMRLVHVLGAGDDELLGRSDFFETEDVAAQVQTHLAPVPDR